MADEDKSKDAEGKKTPAKKDPVDPLFYFQKLKGKKQKCSDETLNGIYANCLTLMEKYNRTGQIDAMKKLLFHLETIERERKVIAAGIDVFVYLDDIKQYINDVGDKVVKIIELDRYEREVPDEVVAKYEKVKDIFDRFIVVFTDYTKQHTEKTQKTRKERDPILFGMFQNKKGRDTITAERCYFIGDWEDEYCDLTLEKLVSEMRPDLRREGEPTVFQLHDPVNLDEIRAKLKAIEEEQNKGRMTSFSVNNINTGSWMSSGTSTAMPIAVVSYPAGNAVDAENKPAPTPEEENDLGKDLPPEPDEPAPRPNFFKRLFQRRFSEEDERAR